MPKVVVTSSIAAIADQGRPTAYTEEDWNTYSTVDFMPYYASKVKSERAAWDFAKEHLSMNFIKLEAYHYQSFHCYWT